MAKRVVVVGENRNKSRELESTPEQALEREEVCVGSVISCVLLLIARWLPAGKDKYLLIQQ